MGKIVFDLDKGKSNLFEFLFIFSFQKIKEVNPPWHRLNKH